MIVDYLHSFYTKSVRIFVGGVPQTIPIRWFRAPAGAKALPIPNTFFSHVWDDHGEAIDGEAGELPYGRKHDPGRNVGYQGQCYRGDPAWFATGQFPAGFPVGVAPGPCLCQIAPAQAAGGIVLAGAATAFRGWLGCTQCGGGAPLNWRLSVSGATGELAPCNGVWLLPNSGPCNWTFLGPDSTFFRIIYSIGAWHTIIDRLGSATEFLPVGTFACAGTTVWRLNTNSGTGGPPTSVVSTPYTGP